MSFLQHAAQSAAEYRDIGVAGVFVLLLLDRVVGLIRSAKNGNGKAKGTSTGDQAPGYWHREFDSVKDEVKALNGTTIRIGDQQTQILDGIRASLQELVTLQKRQG